MTQKSTRHINTGVELAVTVETTGYRGGDSSVTTLTFTPTSGFQSTALLSDRESYIESEEPLEFGFTVRGDFELNALREALRAATDMLDEALGVDQK